ncbi:hypothetical protein GCM10011608_61110 [Micromonospora sonchi]|uniref:Uncharacterized protein n=1 Tax=Micromonospora sonchi TaxID=1763543 RepID=A0A917UC55_9ACTN|nr:hypothetical protein [Micromonospora sonchi]GGM67670.1 hypothetical protein GCM10011608_61110 [Micromonospora sonchi]
MNEETRNRALQAALAEAAAIRSTIERKANYNQNLVGLNLTAVAAVAGIVLSEKADVRLLLLLPVLSAALGLSVAAQYRDGRIAGQYLEQVLRPAIARHTGDETLFGWETYYRQRKHNGHLGQAIAMGLIFPGVSTLALAFTLPSMDSWIDLAAWALSAGMLLLLIFGWSSRLIEMIRVRRGRRQPTAVAERLIPAAAPEAP